MAVEDSTDLAVFFDTADFATAATYRPPIGAPSTVNGIFRNEPVLLEDQIGGGIRSALPMFQCATADLPFAEQGAVLEVDGTVYRIASVQPDGSGVTRLELVED